MSFINQLINNKSSIIMAVVEWQKETYPDRTSDYEKCIRDLTIVYDAYVKDLTGNCTIHTTHVASKYWFNNERQIKQFETEVAVHNYMIDYILCNIIPLETDSTKQHLINLKSILTSTIEHGPEFMNYTYMHKYRATLDYDTEAHVDTKIINDALYEAWRTTPSKQNMMPYNVFVIGPADHKIKELIYYKALMQEFRTNLHKYPDFDENSDPREIEKAMLTHRSLPQYRCFKTAQYLLMFCQRVETQMNPFSQHLTDNGWVFEQTLESKKHNARNVSLIETGMFAQTFANVCLKHNIDISFTMCLPDARDNNNFWADPEFDFLTEAPRLIMTAGKGKVFRRELWTNLTLLNDYKPDFNRVVKFVNGNTANGN